MGLGIRHSSNRRLFFSPYSLRQFLLAFSILLLANSAATANNEKIHFTCFLEENSPLYAAVESIFRQTFAELGLEFSMQHAPVRRGMAQLVKGEVDGLCAHNATLQSHLPADTAIMIDIPIGKTVVTAWSHSADLQNLSMKEILSGRFSVGYPSDDAIAEAILDHAGISNREVGIGTDSAVAMLQARRFEVLLLSVAELIEPKVRRRLFYLGPVQEIRGYPYLHNKHKDLLPAFKQHLQKVLQAQGSVEAEIELP